MFDINKLQESSIDTYTHRHWAYVFMGMSIIRLSIEFRL